MASLSLGLKGQVCPDGVEIYLVKRSEYDRAPYEMKYGVIESPTDYHLILFEQVAFIPNVGAGYGTLMTDDPTICSLLSHYME